MLAFCMDQQVPGLVFNEQAGSVMHHEPTEVFKVIEIDRFIDWQGKVATAFGRAIIAEGFVFLQFSSRDLTGFIHEQENRLMLGRPMWTI